MTFHALLNLASPIRYAPVVSLQRQSNRRNRVWEKSPAFLYRAGNLVFGVDRSVSVVGLTL